MRQRVAELSAKDQATYSMYEGGKRHECDTLEFLKAKVIPVIERVTQLLAHKDTLNMLLLRAKPKVAALAGASPTPAPRDGMNASQRRRRYRECVPFPFLAAQAAA